MKTIKAIMVSKYFQWFMPLFFSVALFAASFTVYETLVQREVQAQNEITELAIRNAKLEIVERLEEYSLALERMGARLEYLGIKDKKFLELDATSYLNHFKGLKRIGLTDTSMTVILSYPLDLGHQVHNFNQGVDSKRKMAFDFALANKRPTMSAEVALKSGGYGFILPVALFSKNRHIGFLYASVDSKLFFKEITTFRNYKVSVSNGTVEVYSNSEPGPAPSNAWMKADPLSWGQANLEIKLAPTAEHLAKVKSVFPLFFLLLSGSLSVITGLLFSLLLDSKNQKMKLLEIENRYRLIIESAKDYAIFMLDASGAVISWNIGARRIKGYEAKEIQGQHFSIFYPKGPEQIQSCDRTLRKATESGHAEEEGWRLRKDGKCIWASVVINRLDDEDGNLMGFSIITKDLTEQRKTQEAFQESKERFDFVTKGINEGIFERNTATGALYLSETSRRIFELDDDQNDSAEAWRNGLHPDDKDRVANTIAAYLEKRIPTYDVEYRYALKNGRGYKWIQARGQAAWDSSGAPIKLAGFLRDITEKKNAESVIIELNQFNEAIFQHSSTGISVFEASGQCLKVNLSAAQISGSQPMDILKINFRELEGWKKSGLLACALEALQSGKNSYFEGDLETITGQKRFIMGTFVPLIVSGKSRIVFHTVDMTEFKKANETADLYRSALDRSAAVYFTDRNGDISYFNKIAKELSGYEDEDIQGKNLKVLKSDLHASDFFKQMWDTLLSGQSWHGEICNRKKSGELYWVDATFVPQMNKQGQVQQYISVQFDITDKKNAEIQLINTAKMSSLGVMAGGISHEINNPLAIIQGSSYSLQKLMKADPIDLSSLQKHADRISSTTARIAKIITGLRTFSQDSSEDPFVEVNVMNLIHSVLELCSARFKAHNIELRLGSILPELQFQGQASQLSHVLINLLNNAFDAVNGTANAFVEINAGSASGGLIEISVTDSGRGIPMEIAGKLMQPFFTTKEAGEGAGLGLSISKGIVKAHHGELWLDQNSRNTRFVIRLQRHYIRNQQAA